MNEQHVTPQDDYIISQALAVAIPFFLMHSSSYSNLKDLMQIFTTRFSGGDLAGILDDRLERALSDLLYKLQDEARLRQDYLASDNSLLAMYFKKIDEFLPQTLASKFASH